jgi:PEP-CTERM motif-containing protein
MNAIRCILFALILVCTLPIVSYADPFRVTLETMMEAQAQNSLYIGHLFGADPSTVLRFTSTLDSAARTFSFSLLPNQSYLGQPISLTTIGSFDATLGQYNWIISGEFGSQSFSGNGSATEVGDDPIIHSQIILGGSLFRITGLVVFGSRSSGIYVFEGPPGTPFAGPFGPYQGTDIFIDSKWEHTVEVPPNPLVPNGLVVFSIGDVPFPPEGGHGDFNVQIISTPEPTTSLLLGTGVVGVAMNLRKRLKTRKRAQRN